MQSDNLRPSFFFCFRKIFFPKSMREGAKKKKVKKKKKCKAGYTSLAIFFLLSETLSVWYEYRYPFI